MRSQFIPECRRERDDVLRATRLRCAIIAKPEAHVMEKMAAGCIPNFGRSMFVFVPKKIGGAAEANDWCSVADRLGKVCV